MSNESTPSQNFISSAAVTSEPATVEYGYMPAPEAPEASESASTSPDTATPPSGSEASEKVTRQTDTHRLAQLAKTERRLAQKQKEAEAIIARADSVKGAFDETDMITALEKLGMKPNEIYRKLTDHVLKTKEPEKTPEQVKEQATEARMKSYEDNLKKVTDELQAERESAAHMQAITQHVAPVINADPSKYETLIDMYGNKEQVIKEVYTAMYNEYQESGKHITAQEAADAMEDYWSSQITTSLEKARKLNKYKSYFKDEAEEQAKEKAKEAMNNKPLSKAERFERVLSHFDKETNSVAQETKSQPKTLSNNMNTSTSNISTKANKVLSPLVDKSAYIAHLLKNS